jgi:cellulose synthase/poly-beta-1,6-N-acetylglucosamine synthase-like glycosyltransferase
LIPLYWFLSLLILVFNVWTLYNIPIVFSGIRSLLKNRKSKTKPSSLPEEELPYISIVLPLKDEEKVAGRLLSAMLKLNYPSYKTEIIVVEDASVDNTASICSGFANKNPKLKMFNRSVSTTKAAALNFGAKHAQGEIIATFDADSVPETDVLKNVVTYFADPSVAAVQGRICTINSEENMLTKFLSYEGAVQYELFMKGKDKLGLFVGLAGTCQFIRREVLETVGGWEERSLSEDTELSLRLVEKDYITKYASDVRTWEESPSHLRNLVRQRVRWYRGNIENGVRFGKLLKKFSLRRFDAEMTLAGTFIIMLCAVNYLMAFWFAYEPPSFVISAVAQLTSILTLTVLGVIGIALACFTRSFRLKSILWLPFIYAYWGFQSLIVAYAILQIILRRPRRWAKTARSGLITNMDIISTEIQQEQLPSMTRLQQE